MIDFHWRSFHEYTLDEGWVFNESTYLSYYIRYMQTTYQSFHNYTIQIV
jgi:hypothetical protein